MISQSYPDDRRPHSPKGATPEPQVDHDEQHEEKSWPDLQQLPDTLPAVEPFDPELLPTPIRKWIVDIAERMQCPLDFPAVGSMVAIASLVGRKVGIRPKRRDDWQVVPNLWGAVVGRRA